MTQTYKNATELCKAHKIPNFSYNRSDVLNILQQYHAFIYKQYHGFYREGNDWYKQILDIIENRRVTSMFSNDQELMTGLELAMMDIKTNVMSNFERMILAPHIVLRSYNLFKSLLSSLEVYTKSLIKHTPVEYPVNDNQMLYIVQIDENGAKYTSKGSVNKGHKVVGGYIANIETCEVIEELSVEQVLSIVNGTF